MLVSLLFLLFFFNESDMAMMSLDDHDILIPNRRFQLTHSTKPFPSSVTHRVSPTADRQRVGEMLSDHQAGLRSPTKERAGTQDSGWTESRISMLKRCATL